MKQRNRLYELLREAKSLPNAEKCVSCPPPPKGEKRPCDQCQIERTVDYLVANGVTVKEE